MGLNTASPNESVLPTSEILKIKIKTNTWTKTKFFIYLFQYHTLFTSFSHISSLPVVKYECSMKKKWCHRGHDLMVVGFITTYMQSVPIIMLLMLWAHDEVYLIQHYVIKFVSYLRKVSGFLRILWFPPSIKLTATI